MVGKGNLTGFPLNASTVVYHQSSSND